MHKKSCRQAKIELAVPAAYVLDDDYPRDT